MELCQQLESHTQYLLSSFTGKYAMASALYDLRKKITEHHENQKKQFKPGHHWLSLFRHCRGGWLDIELFTQTLALFIPNALYGKNINNYLAHVHEFFAEADPDDMDFLIRSKGSYDLLRFYCDEIKESPTKTDQEKPEKTARHDIMNIVYEHFGVYSIREVKEKLSTMADKCDFIISSVVDQLIKKTLCNTGSET